MNLDNLSGKRLAKALRIGNSLKAVLDPEGLYDTKPLIRTWLKSVPEELVGQLTEALVTWAEGREMPGAALRKAIEEGYAIDVAKKADPIGVPKQSFREPDPDRDWAEWNRQVTERLDAEKKDPDPADPELQAFYRELKAHSPSSWPYVRAMFLMKGKFRLKSVEELFRLYEEEAEPCTE